MVVPFPATNHQDPQPTLEFPDFECLNINMDTWFENHDQFDQELSLTCSNCDIAFSFLLPVVKTLFNAECPFCKYLELEQRASEIEQEALRLREIQQWMIDEDARITAMFVMCVRFVNVHIKGMLYHKIGNYVKEHLDNFHGHITLEALTKNPDFFPTIKDQVENAYGSHFALSLETEFGIPLIVRWKVNNIEVGYTTIFLKNETELFKERLEKALDWHEEDINSIIIHQESLYMMSNKGITTTEIPNCINVLVAKKTCIEVIPQEKLTNCTPIMFMISEECLLTLMQGT